ncbi:MAG TPA: hypothetical protein VMA54_00090 [Steroidobacteraceae bacterium]|nr:hypothetical protein [Steroidobacteraceae bacterium]
MTTRTITAQMLYARGSSVRWLGALFPAMEEAAASLCRLKWQHGALQPVAIASSPRRPARRP